MLWSIKNMWSVDARELMDCQLRSQIFQVFVQKVQNIKAFHFNFTEARRFFVFGKNILKDDGIAPAQRVVSQVGDIVVFNRYLEWLRQLENLHRKLKISGNIFLNLESLFPFLAL